MINTSLYNTNLSESFGLVQGQLEEAIRDETTKTRERVPTQSEEDARFPKGFISYGMPANSRLNVRPRDIVHSSA